MKTSNKFTLCRVIVAPIFFVLYFLPIWIFGEDNYNGQLISIISVSLMIPLLIFAELTDYWDGYFARKNKEVSDFGKIFDPFADVFLHLSVFTCLVFSGWMHPVFFVLIFYREFAQNFLRMVAAKKGTAIAARNGGKFKTVFYVISCFVALAFESFFRSGIAELFIQNKIFSRDFLSDLSKIFHYISQGFFAFCTIFAFVSFIDYLKNFGSVLKEAAE